MKRWQQFVVGVGVLVLVAGWATAADAHAQPEARTLRVNGFEMYYSVVGQGPPLVLLHYFGSCGEAWQPHVDALARHYRLIIPDMQGHGRSTDPPGEFTHRQSARDVFALLDHLGIDRFAAMGMSSGGMTLIHMATQQPARVEAMVLIGATIYFPEQARTIMRGVLDGMTRDERAQWARCSARGEAQTEDILRQFYRMKDSYDDMNFTVPYLSTISARTLIVHGDRDEFFPVNIAVEMYQGVPRSALWIVPNGGHLPIFDTRATAFHNQALAFLESGKQ